MDQRPSPARHEPALPPGRPETLFGQVKAYFRGAKSFRDGGEIENRHERRRRAALPRPAFMRHSARHHRRSSSPARHGAPGKINFRRTDPRHPMYEPLRERGWFLIDNVHAAYPGFIALSPEGERMPVARAFRVAGQRTPKCFLRSWLR